MLEIHTEELIDATPMQVWEVLADHEEMHKWAAGVSSCVRTRPGLSEPNGVGAVRELTLNGIRMEERVRTFVPGQRLEYDVIKGAFGWVTRGDMQLSLTSDGGTLLTWRVTMHPYIPITRWLVKAVLERALKQSTRRLKARVEPEPLFAVEATAAQAKPEGVAPTKKQSRKRAPAQRARDEVVQAD